VHLRLVQSWIRWQLFHRCWTPCFLLLFQLSLAIASGWSFLFSDDFIFGVLQAFFAARMIISFIRSRMTDDPDCWVRQSSPSFLWIPFTTCHLFRVWDVWKSVCYHSNHPYLWFLMPGSSIVLVSEIFHNFLFYFSTAFLPAVYRLPLRNVAPPAGGFLICGASRLALYIYI